MADLTDDGCWLADEKSMKNNGCNDSASMCSDENGESLFNETTNKDFDGPLLPQDEEFLKEYKILQEKVKQTTNSLEKKEKEFVVAQKEYEQEIRNYQQVKSEIVERKKVLEHRSEELEKLTIDQEAEISELQKSCEKERQKMSDLEKEEKESLEGLNEKNKVSSSAIKRLTGLDKMAGISINYIDNVKISFSMTNTRNSKEPEKIEVVFSFADSTYQDLVNVQMYPERSSWDDLINEALHRGQREVKDAVWLLQAMKKRFNSTYGLQEEIELLQNRYAIDWLPDQKLVTVILPGKSQSMCKLKLGSKYPLIQQIDCIYSDELIKERVNLIQEMVKKKEVHSLTKWLENLHR